MRRDQALKDYIAAYKGFKRRKKSAKKIICLAYIHYTYKCMLQGIKKVRYEYHIKQYGMYAAFKMQRKLKRGLVRQFGRITFDERI